MSESFDETARAAAVEWLRRFSLPEFGASKHAAILLQELAKPLYAAPVAKPAAQDCVVVPREPTEKMLEAGFGPFLAAHDLMFCKNEPCGPIYKAMLAAAQDLQANAPSLQFDCPASAAPDATLETDSYPTKKVEQQIHEALHPVGMSVHSGKVQLDCSHVQRIIERSRLIERQRNALQAKLVEAEKDAKRHRFARTLFSSDDVTLALDSMRGFVPTEEENLKYDAAIDAALAQEEGR